MAKTIDATLVAHKAQPATTLCYLMKVGPLPDGSYRAFTGLDIDVTYNDGSGERVYKARTGVQMSAISATADLGVDNAEAQSLVPVDTFEIEGFTQQQIDAGDLDKTPYVVYKVNYNDLTPGRHEIMHGGTIGEQRTKFGQLTILELRSLSQQAKQSIGELDSINCRAPFGSVTGVDVRFGCDFDLTTEWVNGTVTSVSGSEPDRVFTDTSLLQGADYFAPGLVEWLTGDNAGLENEVEAFGLSVVELQFPTVNAIQNGDTFRIRRECTKRASGHNSCQTFWVTNWTLHFRGEPHIPIGDTGKLNSAGAGLSSTGAGGTGEATEVV